MSMTQHEPETAAVREPDVNRRGMLSGTGLRAAATVAIGAGVATALSSSVPAQAQTVTDTDILNFALNLEYVEAEFYLRASTGQGLAATDTTGTGTLGSVTGGSAVPFTSNAIQQYAQVLAADEQAHVRFLRAALGSAAVARPTINFTTAFTTLATAAGIVQPGQTFNPFANDLFFLLGAFVFEDVGVTAYGGAAKLISSKTYLTAAASILAVEAYHAGAIRTLLAGANLGAEANAISNLRAQLGGGNEQGLVIPGNANNFAPGDGLGLSFRRTTAQVLPIVYGQPTGTGLFFPNGLNGNIR